MRIIRRFFMPPPIQTPELTIQGIGIDEPMKPSLVNRLHGTGDYLWMFFVEPVTLRVSGELQNYPGQTMVIWEPDFEQVYGNEAQNWLHSWMHCEGSQVRTLLARTMLPVNQPFHLTDLTIVDRYLWDIYRELTSHARPNQEIVINTMHNWLLEMQRQIKGDDPVIPVPFVELQKYMGENLHAELPLAMLATRMNLSVSHFSALFKQYFELSPIEYLIELRMHTASNLLQDGNRSVADVAHAVGYDDPFHFSKQFKARFQVSPRDVRKGHR